MKAAVYILAVLLLVSAALNVILGFEVYKAQGQRDAWCLVALVVRENNKQLGEVLNDREAMEAFMQNQTDAYFAVLDAFNKVAPDMPKGNIPADPELQRLYVLYYKVNDEAWNGDAEKLRLWGQKYKLDTTIPDSPDPIAGGPE